MKSNNSQRYRSWNTFLDVAFALAFFRAIQFLPAFAGKHWTQLPYGILSLLVSEPKSLTRVVFGLIVVVYYWCRKNTVIGIINESNSILEALSTASLAFLFLFLYALVVDPTYVGGAPTLLLQSLSLLFMSLLGFAALAYAIRADLTDPATRSSAERIARIDVANPLAALVAATLSWSGLTIWTLSWFVTMPLFGFLLSKGVKQRAHAD